MRHRCNILDKDGAKRLSTAFDTQHERRGIEMDVTRGRLMVLVTACALAVGAVVPRMAWAQPATDLTPPTCFLSGHALSAGSAPSVQITFEDNESGLASISVLEDSNANVTVATFTVGTTDPVAVTASPTNTNQASFRVKATDVAGNSTDCGRYTFKGETAVKNSPTQDTLTGIHQDQSDLFFFNGTPGFSRLRLVIGRTRIRISLSDGETVERNLGPNLVSGDNTLNVTLGGHGGDSGLFLLRSSPTFVVTCPEAPSKTFAGGPGTSACQQFNGDQAACENAYHIAGQISLPATCFYDTANDVCLGCGPGHSGVDCTNGCFPPPEPCAAPGTIPAEGGTVTGTTSGLSGSTGSCAGAGPEQAFAWTPSFTGGAVLSTCNDGTFDTVIYVREADCSAGAELGCNDDFCGGQSRLAISVTSGTTYYVFVDGFGATSAGDFTLNVTPVTCPEDSSRTIYAGGSNTSACRQFSGDQASCEAAFHTTGYGQPASCFYDSGSDQCVGCGGASTTRNGIMCTNTCVSPPTCSGDASRTTFAGGPFASACRQLTDQSSCEAAFHATLGFQPATCFFDTGACQGCGPRNEDAGLCTDTCQSASDACTSPTVVPAEGGTFTGTTSGKSSATGTCQNSIGPEKAFAWTPSASGTATIETCGGITNFDTVLYVREGTCTGAESACDNDTCFNGFGQQRASRITQEVTSGVTYYIFVDGSFGSAGQFTLTVKPPA
jgi:hypothetical protein